MKKQVVSKLKAPKMASGKAMKISENSEIKKHYLKSRPTCRVTFRLPKEAAPEAQRVSIVGDFNNWNTDDTPMKRLKSGVLSITIELERGKEYRYRYLIDANSWENDWRADRYTPNPFGCDDSVVVV